MEHDPQSHGEQQPLTHSFSATRAVKTILTGVIVVFIFAVAYLSYTFISRGANPSPSAAQQGKPQKVIQLDVLNGSGAKGLAARCTNSLRSRGFDVVEMKNYKVSNIPHTLVVDRVGDRDAARQVASALGVPEKNVIEQLNPDYFVDVSVIIGGDYTSLQPSRPPSESR
jgi:hypothetical protein